MEGLKKVNEGKTKIIYETAEDPRLVLVQSKDRITAGDGARSNELVGKSAISNQTNVAIFQLLSEAGIRTHFVQTYSDTVFIARKCHMIPIEFVTRRIATGSFLKRNPGVAEGYRFAPVKTEYFYKDDANHDPQWSAEQIVSAKLTFGGQRGAATTAAVERGEGGKKVPGDESEEGGDCGGEDMSQCEGSLLIGESELGGIVKTTICVFEILERYWSDLDCTLVDMKVEFGIDSETNEILLADMIDSDSWRLWPSGDRRLMKDKQVYRELKEVTPEALEVVKKNFTWILEKIKEMKRGCIGQIAVIMGSESDIKNGGGMDIASKSRELGIKCHLHVNSAHKAADRTLKLLAHYEACGVPTVIIAIAGRSNGLGPVLSGHSVLPIINCPPLGSDWGAQDVWSSLRLPSGLGCPTVLGTDGAVSSAAQILALNDTALWAKLKARKLNTWIDLSKADAKLRV